jgi:hypothetical protein
MGGAQVCWQAYYTIYRTFVQVRGGVWGVCHEPDGTSERRGAGNADAWGEARR